MRIFISLILVLSSSVLFSQDIDQGLIAHYPFSGNANDHSGNENHGVNFGAVLTEDRFGNANSAYAFNGLDTYISVASSISLESPDTAITMSAWINAVGFSLSGDEFGPVLMKSDNPSNNFMYRFDIYEEGIASALNNWTNTTVAETDLPFNEWHHIAVTYCSTTVKYYLDNILVSEEAFVCNITADELPLEIGRDVPGLLEFFNGAIDDIRIYDRCVTDEEINAIYEEGTMSIVSNDAAKFSFGPNPTTGIVTVRADEDKLFQHIQIVDMLGRVVSEQRFALTNTQVLDLSGLKKGLYSLLIIDGGSFSSNPLLIK